MRVDKNFCMSSYLAFRYIEDADTSFAPGLTHQSFKPIPDGEKIPVHCADELDARIGEQIERLDGVKKGILLSGGMDSAIVASYLGGSDAYTFRFLGGEYQRDELARAEYYADRYGLRLHYVDISWETVEAHLDDCMRAKGAPVHSIEPQILQGALEARADGVELMLVGESSDLVFGGMDGLLAKDWSFDEFVHRYTFTDPAEVLVDPVDVSYLFERYRRGDEIDFVRFIDEVFAVESSGSYMNAFAVASLPYFDPYARLKMADELDLDRIRNGEPKYLVRELMAKKYPDIPVPSKTPMPRPVDLYFADWSGPTRAEFRTDIDMKKLTGNQKWQLFCLERFLNLFDL